MECREIKKFLDQYIDNYLGSEQSAAVKKHLVSCRDCSAEINLLKKYRKEMASLKVVKAPADFLQELNLRIDKQSGFKKMIRTMFFPLKIKLPIEALGVIAASVLVVVLLNPIEQLKENIHIEDKYAYKEKAAMKDSKVKIADLARSANKQDKAVLSLPAEVSDDRLIAKAERKMISAGGETVMTREIVLALYQAKPAAATAAGALKSIAPPAMAPQSEESVAFNAADMKKDMASGARSEADKIASAIPEKKTEAEKEAQSAEIDTVQKAKLLNSQDESVNRQVTIRQPLDDIKSIVQSLNGRFVNEVSGKDGRTQYIIVDMPSKAQKEFLQKLSGLGDLFSKERKPVDESNSQIVRFKINIK
jgi:hypothetical protein